jgi:hypothetical protein
MTRSTYDYRVAELHRIVDGDTYDLTLEDDRNPIDVGFGFTLPPPRVRLRFRLHRVDAWETNEAGGADATWFARDWISSAVLGSGLRGVSYMTPTRITPDGEFGRWEIDLYRILDGQHLSDALVRWGHAKQSRP